jgi:very-short-patch-repair endonuclease
MMAVMNRTALVPPRLVRQPFTLLEAKRNGLERWHLEGKNWRRVGRSTYMWSGLANTALSKLEAARLRLPPEAAFSGLTAAWLHGLDVEPCEPIEATIPKEAGVSGRVGVAVRRAPLGKDDIATVQDMRATSSIRTVGEVCSRLKLTEAVVVADMALHAELVTTAELESWARAHSGRRGVKNLRQVIDVAEPATESPMESRLRMVLHLGGLPRPRAQMPLHDDSGRFLGRPDLYYDDCALAIEYDGAVHRDSLAEDDRRQNRLFIAGIRLLRFTASDVLNHPESVVAQVRSQLIASAASRGIRRHLKTASAGTRA